MNRKEKFGYNKLVNIKTEIQMEQGKFEEQIRDLNKFKNVKNEKGNKIDS
jgi:hypothetical protein